MVRTSNETESFIGAVEAAEHTGYALQTIYGMVSRGEIPFHRRKKGARLQFLRSELDAWVRGQSKGAA